MSSLSEFSDFGSDSEDDDIFFDANEQSEEAPVEPTPVAVEEPNPALQPVSLKRKVTFDKAVLETEEVKARRKPRDDSMDASYSGEEDDPFAPDVPHEAVVAAADPTEETAPAPAPTIQASGLTVVAEEDDDTKTVSALPTFEKPETTTAAGELGNRRNSLMQMPPPVPKKTKPIVPLKGKQRRPSHQPPAKIPRKTPDKTNKQPPKIVPKQQQQQQQESEREREFQRNPNISEDPDEMFLLRNLVRNLDTGEVCQIERVDEIFKEVAQAQTMAQLLDADAAHGEDRKVQQADEHELKESRRQLGFLQSVKKVLRRGHDSLSGKNGAVNQVRVRSHNKKKLDITDLKLIQQVSHHTGPIWSMAWSHDGSFLATGGQDSIVRLWLVKNSAEAKKLSPEQVSDLNGDGKSELPAELGRNVIFNKPYRMYSGHKADVIDLAWSRENFLLSASIDKTVRLWHVSRKKSLSFFQHSDFVTSVCFHPVEDRFFLSGSFDKKLRIWNIPEHMVVEWAQTVNIVTAAAFSPSGDMAVAGLYNGQCIFYQTTGLKYFTQIDCRNRHGKNRKGKKVTAMQFSQDGKQLLITTNDSRIRLYDMNDYSMVAKFKGLQNDVLQIRARFSPDYKHVICGSENEQCYIWETKSDYQGIMQKENRNDSYENFKANRQTCTCALFLKPSTINMGLSAEDRENNTVKHMFVTAGYEGDIKFFENRGVPKSIR